MAVKKANPMQTRTGKPRLGPLNVKQLETLLEKTQQKKNKDIPEGGSKAVILLEPFERLKVEKEIFQKEFLE